jgi:1-acyl-sn-glycerol-3-phosphate acyltransferase
VILFLRSLSFNVFLILWTCGLGLTLVAARWMNQDRVWWVSECWLKGTMLALRLLVGLRYEVRGHEHIPTNPCVFACKHQSAWETLVFALIIKRPVFVIKQELQRIPFFGAYVRMAGVIAIDRSKGDKMLDKLVHEALHFTQAGRSVVIFPEGTRTRVGEKRKYRRRGITTLYAKLAVPIVPVALNSGLFWPRNSFFKKSGTVVIEFLPPIAEGLDDGAFIQTLADSIEGASDRLVSEELHTHPTYDA